jgi:phage terminase large subunit-like protein
VISDHDYGRIVRAQIEAPPPGESQLHAFMRLFWHVVDTSDFLDNWHLHAKCDVLESMSRGELRSVTISEPPASCKTLLCSVFWPLKHWIKDPTASWLMLGWDPTNVKSASGKVRTIVDSDLFKAAFPEFRLASSAQPEGDFDTTKGGKRVSKSVGENITGKHFTHHVYDDLLKPQAIKSDVAGEHQPALLNARRLVEVIATTRAKDLRTLTRLLTAQRLHEMDPTGALREDPDWEHLTFPEEHAPQKWVGLSQAYEKREQEGELLWPARRPPEVIERLKKGLRNDYFAQYNQDPLASGATVLAIEDFHYLKALPKLTESRIVASWDLNFGGKNKSDPSKSRVAWQLWAEHYAKTGKPYYYLLAGSAQHFDYTQSKAKIRALKLDPLWGQAQAWLVEAKANGPAIMSDLEDEFNFVACEPGSVNKVTRMLPHLEAIKCGEVLWDPQCAGIVAEIQKVPKGVYDDHWDCTSQALSYLRLNTASAAQALAEYLRG